MCVNVGFAAKIVLIIALFMFFLTYFEFPPILSM